MCLTITCGIGRSDRVRNSVTRERERERCGCKLSVVKRVERNVLIRVDLVEKIGKEKLVKSLYRANVEKKTAEMVNK